MVKTGLKLTKHSDVALFRNIFSKTAILPDCVAHWNPGHYFVCFVFFPSNFAYILQCSWQKTAILPQMFPKVICGSPITKICIFLCPKMPKTEEKNFKHICKKYAPQNAPTGPKYHLESAMAKICIFLWPKNENNFFLPQMP